MSNVLVRAAQGLTLPEKRVISLCMAKLDSVKLDIGRYKFKITAEEYAQEFDLNNVAAYEQLMDVRDHLCNQCCLKKQFTKDTKTLFLLQSQGKCCACSCVFRGQRFSCQ